MITKINPTPLKKCGINLVSLGCPRNLVDSEVITGRLKLKGARIVGIETADTVIINTCAFIKEAKEESIDVILDALELKKQGRIKKIIISGCLSQRYPKQLVAEFKHIDAIVGRLELGSGSQRHNITPPHYAYLKICEGCFNSCSFCVIPKIKGRFKSRSEEDILDEVRILDKKNITELNVIGQDITCFGLDTGRKSRLVRLVSDVVKQINNIKWLRLLYLNPQRLDKKLIELINKEKKICKYIDLPIQHINHRILKLMNRRITKGQIYSLIKLIRKEIPQVAIRTSLIIGFPSETEEEFKELVDFVEVVRFERLGAFIYSREEGTLAYDLPKQLSSAVKRQRFDILMQKQRKIAKDLNNSLIGNIMEVIIEEYRDNMYIGRSQLDAPEVDGSVFVKSQDKLIPGDIVKVKITDAYEYDLVAEKISS